MATPDEQLLYNALTDPSKPPCFSYWDVATRVPGWGYSKVNNVISGVRRKSRQRRLDWTVAEVGHGGGPLVVVHKPAKGSTPLPLSADQKQSVRRGAADTAAFSASMNDNQAVTLRWSAALFPAVVARQMIRTAKLMEGAAAAAETSHDLMERIRLNGSP
jgi:hypothetical protein